MSMVTNQNRLTAYFGILFIFINYKVKPIAVACKILKRISQVLLKPPYVRT